MQCDSISLKRKRTDEYEYVSQEDIKELVRMLDKPPGTTVDIKTTGVCKKILNNISNEPPREKQKLGEGKSNDKIYKKLIESLLDEISDCQTITGGIAYRIQSVIEGYLYVRKTDEEKEGTVQNPSLPIDDTMEWKLTHPMTDPEEVLKRLERNRQYARAQQAAEKPKGFRITDKENPCQSTMVTKTKIVNHRGVGIAACRGKRLYMEDTHLAVKLKFSVNGCELNAELYGVFDGHGGVPCATFVQEKLPEYLKAALEENNKLTLTEVGIWNALKACFIKLDEDYTEIKDGTTATVAIIFEDIQQLWVANVGDSRTTLIKKNGSVEQASEDAKPSMDRYKRKVMHLGGLLFAGSVVSPTSEMQLAVARAIGDKYMMSTKGACVISPKPKITNYALNEFKEGFLILASDGLHDVASSNELGPAMLQMSGSSMKKRANSLVSSAINHGSQDNVTVMIIDLG